VEPRDDLTALMGLVSKGDRDAEGVLLNRVYGELRSMATARLRSYHSMVTLQPTMLVHEAYLKLSGGNGAKAWDDRRHYFGAAARAMRNIIVDELRRRATHKHGGDFARVELHDGVGAVDEIDADWVLDINDALGALEREDERAARVVELRFFVGLTESETAEALGVSDRTVRRDWLYAKAWLKDALDGSSDLVAVGDA